MFYTYILASKRNGTLYVGVTNDIGRRVYDHKENAGAKFTKKYQIYMLVYYEVFDDVRDAIHREKCMKEWQRAWNIKAIETMNPNWNDLYLTLNA